jgi:hypothetical protein
MGLDSPSRMCRIAYRNKDNKEWKGRKIERKAARNKARQKGNKEKTG